MKILITGGAGMVGSHAAEYFAAKNNKVYVYDSLIRSQIFGSKHPSVEYNWNYLKKIKNITLLRKDIRDKKSLKEVFKKNRFEAIIHTAGQPGVRFSLKRPDEDFQINCLGTVNVLEAVRHYCPQAAFIYCSSNKVYGNNINKYKVKQQKTRYSFAEIKGISESEPIDLTGHTPYGVSKLAGDLYVQDYAYSYRMKTAVFRMSCIYGPRQFGFEDQGWLSWFSLRFLKGKPITIFGDGKQVRDVLWVEDLISAFDKFIQSKLQSEVFNIGGGPTRTLSLLELVFLLEKLTNKKVKIIYEPWRKFDQKVYVSLIEKAKKFLGWIPLIEVDSGLSRLVSWMKTNINLFAGRK
ncbi:MAG: NAD-dependent epimerase/dehydratase family protein [Candidatus Omnitrophica bacterium]|nr:NAD-dependent epimerase/dehydratase family protein [Candidatus Omnitrophota bacterium]